MTILLAHNYYQQPGGEDRCLETEAALLEAKGHRTVRFTLHNDQIADMSSPTVARKTLWNGTAYDDLRSLIRREHPDVVHFHNTFPLISPAAYYAASAEGVPVVQTLHNYRLACVNGLFFRDGHVCEDCLGRRVPWPGVIHGCYRSSRAASGVVAAMLTYHRARRTWTEQVDRYVTPSSFARDKLSQAGLPAERIVVKPNFLANPPPPGAGQGNYALFVGRLSPEKGLSTLITAWRQLGRPFPLKIVGDGPLAAMVQDASRRTPHIEWLGWQPSAEVQRLMGEATLLVFPSEWYETFGLVGMEALAAGTPIVVSQIGAIAELVDPGKTGLHVPPGDPAALAAAVRWALDHPTAWAQMRHDARAVFEARYTPERNYAMLKAIYAQATAQSQARHRPEASPTPVAP